MPKEAAGATTRRGAHTLDLEVGRTLLNASQQVRVDAPFLLVLAGTPGLAAHLGAMDVSFWSRLGEGRLGIGLLSDAAARAALVEPLAAHGEGIDTDALATVVENSQRYPYFIQLWGEALWKRLLATGATRLTAAHAAAARPDVVARVTDYYEDRYLELDQSGWLAVAERVAARFQSRADADLRGVEVNGRRRPRGARGAGAGARGRERSAAAGFRLAAAWTASTGPLRARYPLTDGPRARPRRTGARSAPARRGRRREPRSRASLGSD